MDNSSDDDISDCGSGSSEVLAPAWRQRRLFTVPTTMRSYRLNDSSDEDESDNSESDVSVNPMMDVGERQVPQLSARTIATILLGAPVLTEDVLRTNHEHGIHTARSESNPLAILRICEIARLLRSTGRIFQVAKRPVEIFPCDKEDFESLCINAPLVPINEMIRLHEEGVASVANDPDGLLLWQKVATIIRRIDRSREVEPEHEDAFSFCDTIDPDLKAPWYVDFIERFSVPNLLRVSLPGLTSGSFQFPVMHETHPDREGGPFSAERMLDGTVDLTDRHIHLKCKSKLNMSCRGHEFNTGIEARLRRDYFLGFIKAHNDNARKFAELLAESSEDVAECYAHVVSETEALELNEHFHKRKFCHVYWLMPNRFKRQLQFRGQRRLPYSNIMSEAELEAKQRREAEEAEAIRSFRWDSMVSGPDFVGACNLGAVSEAFIAAGDTNARKMQELLDHPDSAPPRPTYLSLPFSTAIVLDQAFTSANILLNCLEDAVPRMLQRCAGLSVQDFLYFDNDQVSKSVAGVGRTFKVVCEKPRNFPPLKVLREERNSWVYSSTANPSEWHDVRPNLASRATLDDILQWFFCRAVALLKMCFSPEDHCAVSVDGENLYIECRRSGVTQLEEFKLPLKLCAGECYTFKLQPRPTWSAMTTEPTTEPTAIVDTPARLIRRDCPYQVIPYADVFDPETCKALLPVMNLRAERRLMRHVSKYFEDHRRCVWKHTIYNSADGAPADPTKGFTDSFVHAFHCVQFGLRDKLAALLEQEPELASRLDEYGNTLLWALARSPQRKRRPRAKSTRGPCKLGRLLLQHGADINVIHKTTGTTALQEAAASGHHQLVRLLVEAGALNLADRTNRTSLIRALERRQEFIVKYLLSSGFSKATEHKKGSSHAVFTAVQRFDESCIQCVADSAKFDREMYHELYKRRNEWRIEEGKDKWRGYNPDWKKRFSNDMKRLDLDLCNIVRNTRYKGNLALKEIFVNANEFNPGIKLSCVREIITSNNLSDVALFDVSFKSINGNDFYGALITDLLGSIHLHSVELCDIVHKLYGVDQMVANQHMASDCRFMKDVQGTLYGDYEEYMSDDDSSDNSTSIDYEDYRWPSSDEESYKEEKEEDEESSQRWYDDNDGSEGQRMSEKSTAGGDSIEKKEDERFSNPAALALVPYFSSCYSMRRNDYLRKLHYNYPARPDHRLFAALEHSAETLTKLKVNTAFLLYKNTHDILQLLPKLKKLEYFEFIPGGGVSAPVDLIVEALSDLPLLHEVSFAHYDFTCASDGVPAVDYARSSLAAIAQLVLKSRSLRRLNISRVILPEGTDTLLNPIFAALSQDTCALSAFWIDDVALRGADAVAFEHAISVNASLTELHISGIGKDVGLTVVRAVAENGRAKYKKIEGIELRSAECREVLKLDKSFAKARNDTILKYLAILRKEGIVTVKRTRVIFVGNGASGKTTLIQRLSDDTFDEHAFVMTDGIDISEIRVGEVDMTIFDFAGQPEYEHTHGLFFDKASLFLLLHSPRIGSFDRMRVFLQMITNCVPDAQVLMVCTHADEARLSAEETEICMKMSPCIKHIAHVDSKSGSGIKELKKIMVDMALGFENTTKTVPRSFDRLRKELSSSSTSRFSMSLSEFSTMCTSKLNIAHDMISIAVKLFLSWGYLYQLSNGDLVLHPQQLANVMSCIFSKVEATKQRIGDVQEGVLKHTNEVLDAVWLASFRDLPHSMWRCTDNNPISPFIALLYQSGLAFELFDSQGKSMGVSLVPALLPVYPCGYLELVRNEAAAGNKEVSYSHLAVDPEQHMQLLCKLFISEKQQRNRHARLTLQFAEPPPGPFLGRLQVKLRRLALLGGAWKKGCCLVLKDTSGDPGSEETNIQSVCIMYERSDTVLELISAGVDTSARSTIVSAMLALIKSTFPSVRIERLWLTFKRREYSQFDILENIPRGFIEHHATHEKIFINSLRAFFPDFYLVDPAPSLPDHRRDNNELRKKATSTTAAGSSSSRRRQYSLTTADPREVSLLEENYSQCASCDDIRNWLDQCPEHWLKEFTELERSVELAEHDIASDEENDVVYLSDKLLACQAAILGLQGLKSSRKRGLSTLWIVLADATKGQRHIAVPLTPTRPQGNVAWYPLIGEGKVELSSKANSASEQQAHSESWRVWLGAVVSNLLRRVFHVLSVPIATNKWKIKPMMLLSEYADQMRQMELRYFDELDGVMMTRDHTQNAHRMILSKQIRGVREQSQAQERLLVKVVAQNQEQSETLARIEKLAVGLNETMISSFKGVREDLQNSNNSEGMEEFKDLWAKKMLDLEKAVQTQGAENVAAAIAKEMNKVEKRLVATLYDIEVNDTVTENMAAQLGEVKQMLIAAAVARENGEAAAEQRLATLMLELKEVHNKLDRIEAVVVKIFTGLESGLAAVRTALVGESQHLQELREMWIQRIGMLETIITEGAADADKKLERRLTAFTRVIEAKLIDLDVDDTELTSQLAEISAQLSASFANARRGEVEAQDKLEAMFVELRAVQGQLTEVIKLEKQTAQQLKDGFRIMKHTITNLNLRTCPTTFIMLPKPKKGDSEHNKKVLSKMKKVFKAARDPVKALANLSQEKFYIALVCEVCRAPVEDKELWYEIRRPKETVGKLLPLAQFGLHFASALNKVSAVGRIFGLPTPVLSDSTFEDAQEFLDMINTDLLDLFPEMQKLAEVHYAEMKPSSQKSESPISPLSTASSAKSDYSEVDSSTLGSSKSPIILQQSQLGYCIREFQEFLHEMDPHKKWCNLSPRVSEEGDICYACASCLADSM